MSGLFFIIVKVVQIYELLILIRCILSFVRPNPFNPLVQFIYRMTDPLMDAVRNAFPFLAQGGIDFSPIAIFILLEVTVRYLGVILL